MTHRRRAVYHRVRHTAVHGLTPALDSLMQRLLLEPAAASARITSPFRTRRQQAKLYRRYLAGMSPYPAAPPGSSLHEQGRAFDLGGLSSQELQTLGQTWEGWGGRWGGRFGDPIHFEL